LSVINIRQCARANEWVSIISEDIFLLHTISTRPLCDASGLRKCSMHA
jgi:hypothetical protein